MADSVDENVKYLAVGTFLIIIGSLISRFLYYIFMTIIAREGTSGYGIFALGITIINLVFIFVSFGINAGVLRFIAYHKGRNDDPMVRSFINSALKISLISGLISGFVLFIISDILSVYFFKKPDLGITLKLFSIMLPFFMVYNIFITVLLAYRKIKHYVFFDIFKFVLILAFFYILITAGVKNITATLSYVSAIIILAVISYFIANKLVINRLKVGKPNKVTSELLVFSSQIMINDVVQYLILSLDTILIGYFLTSSSVGIYNVAYLVTNVILLLPVAFGAIFYPMMSELFGKKQEKQAKVLFHQVSRWLFLIGLPIVIFILWFSKNILTALFGQDYAVGYLSFIFLSVGIFLYTLSFAEVRTLELTNFQKSLLKYLLISLVFNFILNLVLIPGYGIVGSALVNVFTFLIYSLLCIYKCHKELKFTQQFKSYVKPLIGSLITILVVYYVVKLINIRLSFFVLLPLSIIYFLLYLGSLKLLGAIRKDDIELFKEVVQKLNLKGRSMVGLNNK